MDDTDAEAMLSRAVSLTCGLFAESLDERSTHPSGGSGIFVAPFLVLTASHVLREFFRHTGQPLPKSGAFQTRHGARLFQVDGNREPTLWTASRTWESSWHDMAMLMVYQDGSTRPRDLPTPDWYFPWSVMPPPEGETVRLLGFPGTKPRYVGEDLSIDFKVVPLEAKVTQVFDMRRTRGMYDYPCFEIDVPVEGGFSGGGVFWRGNLCGVVSGGPSWGETTMVSSLWPLSLMSIGESVNKHEPLALYLNNGTIRSGDWMQVRKCISSCARENGTLTAHLMDRFCQCGSRLTPQYDRRKGEEGR